MKNWKKYTLAVAIITVAGFTYVKNSQKNIPSDLRDAVADVSESKDFNTNIPAIKNAKGNVPLPKPAADDGKGWFGGNDAIKEGMMITMQRDVVITRKTGSTGFQENMTFEKNYRDENGVYYDFCNIHSSKYEPRKSVSRAVIKKGDSFPIVVVDDRKRDYIEGSITSRILIGIDDRWYLSAVCYSDGDQKRKVPPVSVVAKMFKDFFTIMR